MSGHDFDEFLVGSNGLESIIGGLGNDHIYPLGGADIVDSGEGDDQIFVTSNDNDENLIITTGPGNDIIWITTETFDTQDRPVILITDFMVDDKIIFENDTGMLEVDAIDVLA